MSISLLSGKAQPYGMLSGHALAPITIDGKQYLSVIEYVYKNLFTCPESKELMSKHTRKPYSGAVKIKADMSDKIYVDALVLGTRARFSQDNLFRTQLRALEGESLIVTWGDENVQRRLSMVFNQLRYSPESVFYDDNYGEVPFETVNAVVAGVAEALMRNPNIPAEPYSVLASKYYMKNAPPKRNLVMALANLDEIVPVLKIKLKDDVFKSETNRFKERLLDATLDYLLKTHYPMLSESEYGLAKRQQMYKESCHVQRYENKLYDMYMNGELPDGVIISDPPNIPASTDVTVEAIEEQAEPSIFELRRPETQRIVVPESLLPTATAQIRVKGVEYPSVLAYAYAMLFDSISVPVNPREFTMDAMGKIANDYQIMSRDAMTKRLTDFNEVATRAKFKAYPALVTLLLTTNGKKLVYSDIDDGVLGIRPPEVPNRAGLFLELLRDEYSKLPQIPTSPVVATTKNIVIKEWFSSRAADYANTLKLFRLRTADDIELIYDIKPVAVNIENVSPDTLTMMNQAGLSDVDQKLVIPFMAADFAKISKGGRGIRQIVASYDLSEPSTETRQLAVYALEQMYNTVRPRLHDSITVEMFSSAILSNQQKFKLKQTQWWRINKWAEIGKKMRRRPSEPPAETSPRRILKARRKQPYAPVPVAPAPTRVRKPHTISPSPSPYLPPAAEPRKILKAGRKRNAPPPDMP